MATLVRDVVSLSYADQETWPTTVSVYQPLEDGQILLPDFVTCLAVKTFFRMCHLKYQVVTKSNAEAMSPSGKVPFIQVGKMLISEFEPIVEFTKSKGFQLNEKLDETDKIQLKAFIALVNNKLLPAELYITWNDSEVYNRVTNIRYGQPYPWPLNVVLPFKKRWNTQTYLKNKGWLQKSMAEVCSEVRQCCQTLSDYLGDHQVYFFGDKPTELDTLVYGHLYSLLTINLPNKQFATIIKDFKNLTEFCQRIDSQYYIQYIE